MSGDDEDDLLKDNANPGATPADLDGVSAEPAEPTNRAPLIPGGQDNDLEFNEGSGCNMTEAGTNCPVHGMHGVWHRRKCTSKVNMATLAK
jgi:hypothetical protein